MAGVLQPWMHENATLGLNLFILLLLNYVKWSRRCGCPVPDVTVRHLLCSHTCSSCNKQFLDAVHISVVMACYSEVLSGLLTDVRTSLPTFERQWERYWNLAVIRDSHHVRMHWTSSKAGHFQSPTPRVLHKLYARLCGYPMGLMSPYPCRPLISTHAGRLQWSR